MTISYNGNIPQPTDIPSQSQAQFLTNFSGIQTFVDIDHVDFATSGAGEHKQITFNTNNVPGGLPSGTTSILYTNAGTAKPSSPQAFWSNQDIIVQAFPIKAWGYLTSGATSTFQGYNISSVVRNAAGNYSVVLTTGAVNSASFGVIACSALATGSQTCINVAPTGTGTFQAFIRIAGTTTLVDSAWSFIVLQI